MSAHWRYPDGRDCFQVPYADPTKGMRDSNLGDAKKLGLIPSTTMITDAWKADGLIKYLQRQMHVATRTTPFQSGTSDDDYYAECLKWAEEHASGAADWGSVMHDLICRTLMGEVVTIPDSHKMFWDPILTWLGKHVEQVYSAETVIVGEGWAGKYDLHYCDKNGYHVLADFKTQGGQPGRKFNIYPKWGWQLGAYGHPFHGQGKPVGVLQSVIISSNEPDRIEVYEWPEPLNYYYSKFQAAFELWVDDTGYDPRKVK